MPTLQQIMQQLALQSAPQEAKDNDKHPDSSETVYISSLALIKMLRHSRAGVPLEVMGLLLGHFVDETTINVVDVFAMPQSGTTVTVESIDPVYQAKMLDMLAAVGRNEKAVGWYHSHPGFSCWLSSVDIKTQESFENLHPRAIAIVVDPIQSVKGKVMIEAFRSINQSVVGVATRLAPTGEARQTTSNLGHLVKPTVSAVMRGLNTKYYALNIDFKMAELEQWMLMRVHERSWAEGIQLQDFERRAKENHGDLEDMLKFAKAFTKDFVEEEPAPTAAKEAKKGKAKEEVNKFGKVDAKQRLSESAQHIMEENILQQLASMVNTNVFH